MEKYKCFRCNYKTNHKNNFLRHIRRKKICKYIDTDVTQKYMYDFYFEKSEQKLFENEHCSSKIPPKSSEIPPKPSEIPQICSIAPPKTSKTVRFSSICSEKTKHIYICQWCGKSFTRFDNLKRHYKRCKDLKINNDDFGNLKELVTLLNLQLEEQREMLKEKDKHYEKQLLAKDKQINELIKKSGITNNIQNNIKILAHKHTDISHLTDKDFIYCLNRANMCIPNLIKKIHFDPEKPENHNIYISNIKNNFVMIYDGNKWVIKDRDESIEDLIDNNEDLLEQKLEEWIENGEKYPSIMKKFNRYLEKKESDSILDTIKKEIKLLLFNNRKLIKNI